MGDPDDKQTFFITVQGQSQRAFNPDNPPAIITTQGSVEDWTVENHAMEPHEFHMHQIHFLLMAINGVPVLPEQQQMLDMVHVGYWSGVGTVSECHAADGFPRQGRRRFRVPLPHPRSRGQRHDGDLFECCRPRRSSFLNFSFQPVAFTAFERTRAASADRGALLKTFQGEIDITLSARLPLNVRVSFSLPKHHSESRSRCR